MEATMRNNESGGWNHSSVGSDYPARCGITLYTYALPIIATLGIFLNTVLLAILRVFPPTCEIIVLYLKAIAISDIGFLVFALFPWIQMVFQINVYHNVGFCQLVNFAMTVFPSLSLIYILFFAITGVVWKTRPWLRQKLPEVVGSKFLLVGITFFAVYLQVYPLWFWESSEGTSNQCTVHRKNVRMFNVFLKVDMFKDILIQVTVIAVGVGYGLARRRFNIAEAATSTSTTTTPSSANSTITDIYGSDFGRLFFVFIMSLLFSSLPTNVVVFASLSFHAIDLGIWLHFIGILFYIYFAVKPLGYFIGSSEFRKIIQMFIHSFTRRIYSLWSVQNNDVDEV